MTRAFVPMLAAAAMMFPVPAASAGDPTAGRRVYNTCIACHTPTEGGRHGVGPNLWAIYGSPAAAREGFRYSANMRELAAAGLVWNEENLRRYLTNPKDLVPRGSMAFAGVRNPQQLTDLIAFLRTLR